MDRFRLQPRRAAIMCTAAFALALGTGALAVDRVSARTAPTHKGAVTPRPGRYSGFVGPFIISFKSNSKQITSLASTFNPPRTVEFRRISRPSTSRSWRSAREPSPARTCSTRPRTRTRAGGTMHGHFSLPHNALPTCSVSTSFTASRVGK